MVSLAKQNGKPLLMLLFGARYIDITASDFKTFILRRFISIRSFLFWIPLRFAISKDDFLCLILA